MTIRFIPIGMQQANLHLSVDPRSNPKAIPSPLAIVVEFKKLPLYLISVTSLTYMRAPGIGRLSKQPTRNLPRKTIQSYWLPARTIQLAREAQEQRIQELLLPILSGRKEPRQE